MLFFCLLVTIVAANNFVSAYEECQGEFCPRSVPKPKTLSFGNTLGPLVGMDPVTGCFCRERVELFALCYGRNGCTSMTHNITLKSKVLKLTSTHITTLGPGDFQRLEHLIDLQIEGNHNLERIKKATFQYLHNLQNLSVAFNTKLMVLEEGVFSGLLKLEYLFLNNNAFENIYYITSNLASKVVPRLRTLILDFNSFLQIDADAFRPMLSSTLEELSLSLCRIEYVHPETLIPLKNLRRVHLGENNINTTVLVNMLRTTLDEGIDLQTLNLYFMGFKRRPPRDMMEVIAKSNITELNLSRNQFEVISRDFFPLMPSLAVLDLREVLAVQVANDAFANLPNLRSLFISGNRLTQISKGILDLQNLTFLDMQDNSPGNYYHIYFAINEVDFTNMKRLKYLNLAFNGLAHLFESTFRGLNSLEMLVLKNSSVFFIEKNTFAHMTELRVLNLMNNLMVHGDAVPDVFFNLTKLEILLLSGCKFMYITKSNNPFRNLKSLKYLGLDRNLLKNLGPTDFQPLTSVANIDLSFNQLISWEQRIFAENANLSRLSLAKNKLTDLTEAMLNDFASIGSVNLDQNSILCKCLVTYTSYKRWHKATNNYVFVNRSVFEPPLYCGYPESLGNVTVVDFLTKSVYGQYMCNYRRERIYTLLPLIIILVLLATMGVLAFWYRWHIKYWIFLSKLHLSRKGKIKPKKHKNAYINYEYDAFVSYSTEDQDFVIKLVTMMENHEPFLRLCVYERDFQIGTIISESVLESVAKSRKTVLVISDNYAKSQWCRWESQICEHHRLFFENEDGEYVDDSLVLIKLGPVSDSYLTPTLKYLLKTRIYLQWGWDERKQEVFWHKLRSALGPPIREITHI